MRDWDGHCHRCGKASLSSIMSMFNEELICMDCKAAERKRPDYKLAEARDLEQHADRMVEVGCSAVQVASVREAARKLREGEETLFESGSKVVVQPTPHGIELGRAGHAGIVLGEDISSRYDWIVRFPGEEVGEEQGFYTEDLRAVE